MDEETNTKALTTTQLIAKLQSIVDDHGDLPVFHHALECGKVDIQEVHKKDYNGLKQVVLF